MVCDFGEPLSQQERDELIEKIAANIHRRRLEVPAILFLEMHKPLSFFVSQTLIVTSPLIAPLVGFGGVSAASRLLEDRENVERLIRRLEELAAGAGNQVQHEGEAE